MIIPGVNEVSGSACEDNAVEVQLKNGEANRAERTSSARVHYLFSCVWVGSHCNTVDAESRHSDKTQVKSEFIILLDMFFLYSFVSV